MGHGGGFKILGMGPLPIASLAAYAGYLYWLTLPYRGPYEPKSLIDPELAEVVKERFPQLDADYYNKEKFFAKLSAQERK